MGFPIYAFILSSREDFAPIHSGPSKTRCKSASQLSRRRHGSPSTGKTYPGTKPAFDDVMRTWEQLIGVKSIEQAVEIPSQYAKRVYDNHMAELSKLREMYTDIVRDSSKPIEETTR